MGSSSVAALKIRAFCCPCSSAVSAADTDTAQSTTAAANTHPAEILIATSFFTTRSRSANKQKQEPLIGMAATGPILKVTEIGGNAIRDPHEALDIVFKGRCVAAPH